jgi:hypothetical protein
MWCNFKFEGLLFRSDSIHNDRVDSLLECATKQAVITVAKWHRNQIIRGLWLLAKKKLKMDSCLRGAILILTAFCSIWTLIEECSSIKYLLIEIYFKNFILQILAYVEKLQSNEKKN